VVALRPEDYASFAPGSKPGSAFENALTPRANQTTISAYFGPAIRKNLNLISAERPPNNVIQHYYSPPSVFDPRGGGL
ncbi:MAG: hypothetical protein P9M14_15035, partial [Candidatus Alcyoniella australis]|nr:hypothetical protein [Candidatus Alcyoniella australis]